MTTLGALIDRARQGLAAAGVATPDLDARLLIAHALGLSPLILATDRARNIDEVAAAQAEALVLRRAKGEPVDRILGAREFWGLTFLLGPDTLSPRPDTETLIEAALAALPDRAAALRVLDLGTGSGALLLALLAEYPCAIGTGVDISTGALAVAAANAQANGLADRAVFRQCDWAQGLEGPFDLIVSNPPYIETATLARLDREVIDHDPRAALDGGADGLESYRAIVIAAPRLLAPGGVLILELGQGQEAMVSALLTAQGLRLEGPARPDLGGVARALVARR